MQPRGLAESSWSENRLPPGQRHAYLGDIDTTNGTNFGADPSISEPAFPRSLPTGVFAGALIVGVLLTLLRPAGLLEVTLGAMLLGPLFWLWARRRRPLWLRLTAWCVGALIAIVVVWMVASGGLFLPLANNPPRTRDVSAELTVQVTDDGSNIGDVWTITSTWRVSNDGLARIFGEGTGFDSPQERDLAAFEVVDQLPTGWSVISDDGEFLALRGVQTVDSPRSWRPAHHIWLSPRAIGEISGRQREGAPHNGSYALTPSRASLLTFDLPCRAVVRTTPQTSSEQCEGGRQVRTGRLSDLSDSIEVLVAANYARSSQFHWLINLTTADLLGWVLACVGAAATARVMRWLNALRRDKPEHDTTQPDPGSQPQPPRLLGPDGRPLSSSDGERT